MKKYLLTGLLLFSLLINKVQGQGVMPEIRSIPTGTLIGPLDGLNFGQNYRLIVYDHRLGVDMLHPTQGIEAINGTLMPMDLGHGYEYVGTTPTYMSADSFEWEIKITGIVGPGGLRVDFGYFDDIGSGWIQYAMGTWNVNSEPLTVFISKFWISDEAIHWQVRSEHDVSRYEIEYSNDAISFHKISSVNANGSNSYLFKSENDNFLNGYYRLKIINNNEAPQYSNVIVRDEKETMNWMVQNPVYNTLNIIGNRPDEIIIFNITGNKIKTINHLKTIDVSDLNEGVYIVELKSHFPNQISQLIKVVKL